ncbi:MAG: PAS domain-containing protein [Lachnospiraceae bacterium]|nr:PAS domain-containing protein [Lachnospiraceae bacterium]
MDQSGLFQFSADHALEDILIFDESGRICYVNRSVEQHLEYKKAELYGCLITDIFSGTWELKEGRIRCGQADGSLQDMMAYRKNGTCFPVKARLLVYRDLQDGAEGHRAYICMAHDVSNEIFLEKKASRAGQEAEEALKVKSEFVANVTHELRTPVNGILGNIQELIRQETETDKLKLLHLVERGCHDMNALINNILDFSKLEAGKFTLEARSFPFRNMVDYVKSNHSSKIIEKGLEFSVTVAPDIPEHVIGDELRIVQILNNLLSNACKFTSVGSIHVEIVQTARSGNRAELFFIVTDTGIGISKTDQDKLFQSFSQVDASISRKYGGTGLGLNICKQLVELMGGSIHVDSEPGKGTRFFFHIWVEIPQDEAGVSDSEPETIPTDEQEIVRKLKNLTESSISEKIWSYGEKENQEELDKKMSKLILSVEMGNWEKAEQFIETIKQLVEGAPREVKSVALRLKMAVQKGDYEKTTIAFEKLQQLLHNMEEPNDGERNEQGASEDSDRG